jgi:hypothetical protein
MRPKAKHGGPPGWLEEKKPHLILAFIASLFFALLSVLQIEALPIIGQCP